MSADTVALAPTLDRDRTATLLGRTMGLVGLTAATFTLGAYLARGLSAGWGWLFFGATVACLLALNTAVKRSEPTAVGLLLVFGASLGAALAPTMAYYAGADPLGLVLAAGATALFITGFGAAGYATRRDLSGLERTLFWALVGLAIFGVVLIFVELPGGALVYAVVGLVVFAGLTSLDFQRLRRSGDIKTAPLLAASIFLDILNVFELFLSLFRGDAD
ncbi:Bax inhibitor-1/YccA family protein [Modestobacter excelsi]|uniref:Bax inhibitor-1/YccA family protein n=1 Tax=Modestobacter excelsi TaxID=2213161 RepID=UPI00110CCF27|nr:Bax inhibitor-1 family protein [Modestobacter excelsi]